jgi:hypothetical protein
MHHVDAGHCLKQFAGHWGVVSIAQTEVFPAIVGSARKIVLEIAQPLDLLRRGARISGFVGRSAAHKAAASRAGRFPAMALASAAVHSNKKTVVYYELPPANRHPDRPPLAAVRSGHLATFPDADTRAAAGRREMDRNRRREIITGVFRSA